MGFEALLSSADSLALSILGQAVTYTTGAGAESEVTGIFDAAFVAIMPSGAADEYPAVFFLVADLPSDPETDTTATVAVDSVEYAIREARPDGKGGIVLLLVESV